MNITTGMLRENKNNQKRLLVHRNVLQKPNVIL